MKAMVLKEFCEIGIKGEPRRSADLPLKTEPLEMVELPDPVPDFKQILVRISACGICHTELDEIEGRLVPPQFPIVLGHEVVGTVESLGSKVTKFKAGDRIVDRSAQPHHDRRSPPGRGAAWRTGGGRAGPHPEKRTGVAPEAGG